MWGIGGGLGHWGWGEARCGTNQIYPPGKSTGVIIMECNVCFLFVGRYRSSINDTSCTPRVNPQVGYDSDMGPDYDIVM